MVVECFSLYKEALDLIVSFKKEREKKKEEKRKEERRKTSINEAVFNCMFSG